MEGEQYLVAGTDLSALSSEPLDDLLGQAGAGVPGGGGAGGGGGGHDGAGVGVGSGLSAQHHAVTWTHHCHSFLEHPVSVTVSPSGGPSGEEEVEAVDSTETLREK